MIVLLYSLSSFVNSLALSINCSLHLCVSLHFSNLWTKFSSSLYRGHLLFPHLSFYLLVSIFPIYSTLTPFIHSFIHSFGLHWSIHISLYHSCFPRVLIQRPQAHTLSRIVLWNIKYGAQYDDLILCLKRIVLGTNREQRNYVINILDG